MTNENETLLNCARRMLSEGQDLETVISFLRDSGCHKNDSIKIVRQLTGVGLGEAKDIVHFSNTWKDVKERDEAFHEVLEEAILRESGSSTELCRED